jgi:hypothetical protein
MQSKKKHTLSEVLWTTSGPIFMGLGLELSNAVIISDQ